MSGYLDHYGEGFEQRAKRTKLIVAIVLIALFGGGGIYIALRNYRQKAQVKQFVELLQKGDYNGAYRLWGCTESKPCPDYPFNKFMEDWGPKSKYAQIASFRIAKSQACGSGVIVTVDLGQNRNDQLWVETSDMTIGFSPMVECPPQDLSLVEKMMFLFRRMTGG
jgi:hypothetical protein